MSPYVDHSTAAAADFGQTPGPVVSSNATTALQVESRSLRWSALGLTAIIVSTAAGNLLVCAAVCLERRLQNITNYFLMSLAIADLLVSLLVMPLAMVVELFGNSRSTSANSEDFVPNERCRTVCDVLDSMKIIKIYAKCRRWKRLEAAFCQHLLP